jgi:WD40 repeat protein
MSKDIVTNLSFNDDNSLIAISTDKGFKVYSTLSTINQINVEINGGTSCTELLMRTNIIVFVGTGRNLQYPKNKAFVWDDTQKKSIGTLTVGSDILKIKINKKLIILITDLKVYVYQLGNLKLLDNLETARNDNGLCEFRSNILVSLGLNQGTIKVDFYEPRGTVNIKAHDNPIGCIALNSDGTMLATASEKGTIIRVFNTYTGKLTYEFRRAITTNKISSMNFDSSSDLLAILSQKITLNVIESATLRVISLKELNSSSTLGYLKQYFSSYIVDNGNLTQLHLPNIKSKAIIGFMDDNNMNEYRNLKKKEENKKEKKEEDKEEKKDEKKEEDKKQKTIVMLDVETNMNFISVIMENKNLKCVLEPETT